jgi:hypothetical protein
MSITIRPGRRLTASSNAALRNPVITGKSDQLLDVAILVILKLGGIRKIERPSHSPDGMGERMAPSQATSSCRFQNISAVLFCLVRTQGALLPWSKKPRSDSP